MNQIFDCRFLNTAQNLSDEDIDSSELQSQLNEFILQAKALLCGHQYLDVSDTFDSLLATFDKVLSGGKKLFSTTTTTRCVRTTRISSSHTPRRSNPRCTGIPILSSSKSSSPHLTWTKPSVHSPVSRAIFQRGPMCRRIMTRPEAKSIWSSSVQTGSSIFAR